MQSMADSKRIFVNFSGDSYDVPEIDDNQNQVTLEPSDEIIEENVVPEIIIAQDQLNDKIHINEEPCEAPKDDAIENEELPDSVEMVGPDIQDSVTEDNSEVSTKDRFSHVRNLDPIDHHKAADNNSEDFRQAIPLGKEDNDVVYLTSAVEDCQNVGEESKFDKSLEDEDRTGPNTLIDARELKQNDLPFDGKNAEIESSHKIDMNEICVMEKNNNLDNSADNFQMDVENKDYSESVISDENNNEITINEDKNENENNEDSSQLNSDRMFVGNEQIKITPEHPPVYINLMKETLEPHNFIDRDSQLSLSDMDAKFVDSARSETRPQTTSTMRELPGGLRAKANTPASLYMANNELDVLPDDKGIETGRAASRASREEVFQRAMTLMSNRCTSAREDEDVLFSSREPPFGIHIPQYFYVHQRKPTPMPPLKAWRGYKGNVYFEPMSIKSVFQSNSSPYSLPSTAMGRHTPASTAPTRATTAGMSKKSYRLVNTSPQIFIMDKHTVIRSDNYDIEQDLRFLEGIESTGSLAVRPPSSLANVPKSAPGKPKEKRLLYKRDRICKGPNFHNIHNNIHNKNLPVKNNPGMRQGGYEHYSSKKSQTSGSRKSSFASSKISTRKQRNSSPSSKRMSNRDLMISGDKFSLPTVMSPVLRTSAQFPLHDKRGPLMESPDVYKTYTAEIPALDRVHVSLEHIDISDENYDKTSNYDQSESYPEALPPFVDISFKKATVNPC